MDFEGVAGGTFMSRIEVVFSVELRVTWQSGMDFQASCSVSTSPGTRRIFFSANFLTAFSNYH